MRKSNGNLKPFSELDPEEAKAIRSAGGKASKEVRRRKAELKSIFESLLAMPMNGKNELQDFETVQDISSVNGKSITVAEKIALEMIMKCLDGDRQTFETIVKIIGQMEPEPSVKNKTSNILDALKGEAEDINTDDIQELQ